MNFEMRWLVRNGWDGPEKVLQYRNQIASTDYSSLETTSGFVAVSQWSDWKNVPIVDKTH